MIVSFVMTSWRTKIRRAMNERDTATRGIVADVLMGWETVKVGPVEKKAQAVRRLQLTEPLIFRAVLWRRGPRERAVPSGDCRVSGARVQGESRTPMMGSCRPAAKNGLSFDPQVVGSLNLLNLCQNFIISVGLLLGSLMVANRVVNGDATPAEFVVFISYLAQLSGPLNNLGQFLTSESALLSVEIMADTRPPMLLPCRHDLPAAESDHGRLGTPSRTPTGRAGD